MEAYRAQLLGHVSSDLGKPPVLFTQFSPTPDVDHHSERPDYDEDIGDDAARIQVLVPAASVDSNT